MRTNNRSPWQRCNHDPATDCFFKDMLDCMQVHVCFETEQENKLLYSYYSICVYRVPGASGSLIHLSFKETVQKRLKDQ